MQLAPKFRTAIPRQRYRLGEFSVVVLADIESLDGVSYAYILAFVPDGQQEPLLYITCERYQPSEGEKIAFQLRVIGPHEARIFGSDERWAEMASFVTDGLLIGRKLLELMDEEPLRLM